MIFLLKEVRSFKIRSARYGATGIVPLRGAEQKVINDAAMAWTVFVGTHALSLEWKLKLCEKRQLYTIAITFVHWVVGFFSPIEKKED